MLHEFESVSEEALIELVRRALSADQDSLDEILELIATPAERVANVAERLLTGRRAEEHFIHQCESIIGVPSTSLVDLRHSACGFDFYSQNIPDVALEVKGIKQPTGDILFTEREWVEAESRRENYWVIVVGNLSAEPSSRVFRDPTRSLQAKCQVIKSTSTVWTAQASVA